MVALLLSYPCLCSGQHFRCVEQVTVAEVEELVEPGVLDGDSIHTPGIFVQRIIQGEQYTKMIEKRTVRKRAEGSRAVVA